MPEIYDITDEPQTQNMSSGSGSRAVQRRDAAHQQRQMQRQAEQQRNYELREAEASASAQAGLNLNIFAALSGSMFSRSKKTTDTKADGSSHSVEHKETAAVANGHGKGSLQMIGKGEAHARNREVKSKGAQQQLENSKEAKVDHLGIEGW